MEKTIYSINMNYRRGLQQAAKLEEMAGKIRTKCCKTMEQAFSEMQQGWQGENADAYTEKSRCLIERIENTAGQLENAAAIVRQIVINTYKAEMTAYRIANNRTYH